MDPSGNSLEQKTEANRKLLFIGKAIVLPVIFLLGPATGFVIAKYLLVDHLGLSAYWVPAGIFLGLILSCWQIYKINSIFKKIESNIT